MENFASHPDPAFPSPWLTTWFSPRRTIRRIVEAEAPPSWWPVIALALLGQVFGLMQFDPDETVNVSQSAMPVVLGALQTVFGVLVGPFLLAFVGGWLGGEADPGEIRQAIAWGYLPFAVAGLCWIPLALAYRGTLSQPEPEIPLALVPLVLAAMVGVSWSIVTQVIMLAEVQRFSIFRAIASMVVLLIPAFLLGLL